MEKKNIPQLRFQGFCEEWERKKLGDLVTFVVDNRGKTPPLSDKGIPLIEIASVGNYKVDYSQVTKWISEITFQESLRNYLEEGDILFSTVGSTGLCSFYEARTKAAVAQNIIGLRFSGDNSAYMLCLLQVPRNSSHIKSIQMNGVQGSIKVPQLLNLYFQISNNLDEQTQIGTLFQTIDTLLTTQKQKHKNLLQLKKAMLSKLFPQKGQTVPDVRFKGFQGDWVERELGDIGSVAMNKRIFKHQTATNEEIPFFKIGTFGEIPDAFIARELFEAYKEKYPYPQIGDILLSASGSIGKMVEYTGKDEYFQDSNIVWFQHGEDISNGFLKCFYTFVKWEGLEGSTIKRLYNKNILETKITYPEISEQTLIGNYFQALDKRISLQENEIKTLENLKKALLDKLFVS